MLHRMIHSKFCARMSARLSFCRQFTPLWSVTSADTRTATAEQIIIECLVLSLYSLFLSFALAYLCWVCVRLWRRVSCSVFFFVAAAICLLYSEWHDKVFCNTARTCGDTAKACYPFARLKNWVIFSAFSPYRFWYISLVACYRNTTTCTWHHFDASKFHANNGSNSKQANAKSNDFIINYDIHLVNGNPNQSSSNPLAFQFSFDQQNILEMNLIFFFVYLILVPMQIYAVRIQKHPVTKLFTLSLILEFVSLVFILSYYIRYAASGVGNEAIKTTGDILDILSRVNHLHLNAYTRKCGAKWRKLHSLFDSQTTFMLILLLLAKGWAVTRQQVTKSGWILLMSIWIPYCAFHVVLYVWNRVSIHRNVDKSDFAVYTLNWQLTFLFRQKSMWYPILTSIKHGPDG